MKLTNIQKAIYQYFSTNLDEDVEDRIDLDTKMPYVALADFRLTRESARGIEGFTYDQEILVFSNANGKSETIGISDKIRQLVLNESIEIEEAEVHTQSIESITIQQLNEKVYEASLHLKLGMYDY